MQSNHPGEPVRRHAISSVCQLAVQLQLDDNFKAALFKGAIWSLVLTGSGAGTRGTSHEAGAAGGGTLSGRGPVLLWGERHR